MDSLHRTHIRGRCNPWFVYRSDVKIQKVNLTKKEGKELLKKILVHSEKKGIPTFPKKKKA